MSVSTDFGRRVCGNCSQRIPPGRGTRCPRCQHPLVLDDKDKVVDPLAATGVGEPTEQPNPPDALTTSPPIVPKDPLKESGPPPPPEWSESQPMPPRPPRRAGRAVGLVALTAVLAVGLGYAAFRVAQPILGPPVGQVTAQPSTSAPPAPTPTFTEEPSPTPSNTDGPSPTPEPEPKLKRVKDVTAKASSTLPPNNYTYDVENTLDRDPVTAWNSNGNLVGPLAQVTLTYRFKGPVDLREIEIYNGYQRSDETFLNNSRVRKLLVTTDATEESFELKDKQGKQTIQFDFGKTDKVVLTILEVHRNETTKYNDCAISEVTFFGV